ncbi:hypothetical protein ACIOKD_40065 [Streptomyces sp. NPDC087844]|uniref:hypothetical protein n=1 Tax=Streptomyces sp. NPDC087844 TaxID=3365805 RepID=UPI00380F1CE6
MIDASVAPHTASTAGQRAAAARRDGAPSGRTRTPHVVVGPSALSAAVSGLGPLGPGGDQFAPAVPAVPADSAAPARPEPEGADFTTVFDIMGRIFSAV